MVAYNFQKQFVEPIRLRVKQHTIRKNGKRRHARPGEMLQLYCGQRTKSCFKIIDDVECFDLIPIQFDVREWGINSILMGGVPAVGNLERFAREDGFESWEAMQQFWIETHGTGIFTGSFIQWRPKK